MKNYVVKNVKHGPGLDEAWDAPDWSLANTLEVTEFREESSDHRPETFFRMLYDSRGLYGKFLVRDRYVVSLYTKFHDPVCKDSCVEFFVKPRQDKGYINFEFNCGGVLHASYITDETRTDKGFKNYTPLSVDDGQMVQVYHSMPEKVDPEITEPVEWTLAFFVPFELFEKYTGPLGVLASQEWRANFYKCSNDCSHPHWAAWSPVNKLNFHLPECFGKIVLGEGV